MTNHDTNFGTAYTFRGDLTQTKRLITGTSNYLTTSMTYDTTGQVVTSTDAKGNQTSYDYTDNFYNDSGDSSNPTTHTLSQATNAYLKKITHPTANSVTQTDTFGYYWGTGQRALSTDPNSQTKYFHFYDPLNRPTSTKLPDGGWTYSVYPYASETQVDTGVGITSPTLSINCPVTSNGCLHDQVLTDGLGRATSNILVSDPSGQTSVNTAYDSNGRVYSISNPHRSGSSPTDGTEYYVYDGLDRKTKVTRTDGSLVYTYYGATVASNGGRSSQLCSGYGVGYPILYKDEAAKLRQTWTDGFGRVIEADEPDSSGSLNTGVGTCYSYDLNNNLLSAVQNGSRQRSFVYDLLSRLTQASNPESGTTNYYYTTSGGGLCAGDSSAVCRKTDARSITTTSSYDALNRPTQRSYSDGTPALGFTYDVAPSWMTDLTNVKGRLVEAYNQYGGSSGGSLAAATVNSYDSMGRIVRQWQQTPLSSPGGFFVYYGFDLAGDTTSYGTGNGAVTFSQAFDSAGRVTQLTSSAVDAQHPATLATVGQVFPSGAPELLNYGNNLHEIRFLNNRLQTCRINVDTNATAPVSIQHCADNMQYTTLQDFYLHYNEGTADNGNVSLWNGNYNRIFSRSFTYDPLNRLASMSDADTVASCQGASWSYDAWGNRLTQTPTKGSCGSWNQGYDPTNRIAGWAYDAAGNLLNDGSHSYAYDAENRLTAVDGGSTASYAYDASGLRVGKIVGSTRTNYLYDLSSNVVSEINNVCASICWAVFYARLNGQLVAEYKNLTTYFFHKDHLGSTRLMTNVSGGVYDSLDYMPFGEQIAGDTGITHKFTGKERDAESAPTLQPLDGLDYFGARYYSSLNGRFMTPDWSAKVEPVPYAKLEFPQTLNLYAYADNNPIERVDVDGHGSYDEYKLDGSETLASVAGRAEVMGNNPFEAMSNFATDTFNQAQNQQQQNTAPANSRTDVVLHGREYTPTPNRTTPFFWTMGWIVSACSAQDCSKQTPANMQQTITLVESKDGGPWEPTGDPMRGVARDQISPEGPRSFNQHWFVDGKQVQLVVGRDGKGNLIRTWEAHVVVEKTGDRPVYSAVP